MYILILFLINSRQLQKTVGAMFNRTFMNYQSLVAVSVSIEFVFYEFCYMKKKKVLNNLLTCKIADIYNLFADTERMVRK